MYEATKLAERSRPRCQPVSPASQRAAESLVGRATFESRIRRNIRLAEAPSFGQSIFDYAPDSPGAEDYGRLAAEVLKQQRPAALVA